ncbi:FeoA family protein [Rhodomicrobium lacus]|uniref:FeoA family protein n=1 Tax=Rhodomicrobium lacus TaxID=2498452 RepID=UPI001AECA4EC
MITLENLRVGENARVVGFSSGDRGYRQRLLAMGLTPGATFSVQHRSAIRSRSR